MLYNIINILLYAVPTYAYWKNRKVFDYYLVIMLLYSGTACLCCLYYSDDFSLFKDLQFFPFVYLFSVLMIFFYPLKGFTFENKKYIISDSRALKYLGYFYILVALADIAMSFNHTSDLIQSGEWGALRNQLDEGAEGIEYYSNQWERLVKNLNSYLGPFALVYAFFLLTKKKLPKLFCLFLFFSIVIPAFMAATVEASRGMIMHLAMNLGITYMLFSNHIPKNRKKYIYGLTIFMLVGFLAYTIAVTISRFGEEDVGDSLYMYFGHSMLYFNDGIFNNMHHYAWGRRFFSWFIDIFGGNSYFSAANAGATHGSAFYTFVGGVFIDWGPIGTIIASFIACRLVLKWFRKDTLRLSDCIIIVFYVSTLANGVFCFGSGRALTWFMTFVVYYLVRKIETTHWRN